MEIGNKILELRKKLNITQEELADKVGVSRQTISKWELGETAPDLKQSKELSKIFNVSLDELVDNDVKAVITEKVSNTEKLAGLILKILKILGIFIVSCLAIIIVMSILLIGARTKNNGRLISESITCTLRGETYGYGFRYYENNGEIKEAGGDSYLANITDIERYPDAHTAMDKINAYIEDRGGTCTIKSEGVVEE